MTLCYMQYAKINNNFINAYVTRLQMCLFIDVVILLRKMLMYNNTVLI